VPFALLVQIGIVTLIYVAVQWVALAPFPDLGPQPPHSPTALGISWATGEDGC